MLRRCLVEEAGIVTRELKLFELWIIEVALSS